MDFLDLFYVLAPEFSDQDVNFLETHLNNANGLITQAYPEFARNNMVVYLAAHNIDLATKRQGSSGQVKSITEGGLSMTFETNGNITSEYDLSSYGRRYKELIRSYTITPITRVSSL